MVDVGLGWADGWSFGRRDHHGQARDQAQGHCCLPPSGDPLDHRPHSKPNDFITSTAEMACNLGYGLVVVIRRAIVTDTDSHGQACIKRPLGKIRVSFATKSVIY